MKHLYNDTSEYKKNDIKAQYLYDTKSRLFDNQTLLDHWNTRLVQYSDGYGTTLYGGH